MIAYSVGQRTREIGLRVALGAQKRDIFRLIVGEGMGLAAAGVLVGLAGAIGLSRFLESLLFEIKPSDPLTFSSGAILLSAVAFLRLLASCHACGAGRSRRGSSARMTESPLRYWPI